MPVRSLTSACLQDRSTDRLRAALFARRLLQIRGQGYRFFASKPGRLARIIWFHCIWARQTEGEDHKAQDKGMSSSGESNNISRSPQIYDCALQNHGANDLDVLVRCQLSSQYHIP